MGSPASDRKLREGADPYQLQDVGIALAIDED